MPKVTHSTLNQRVYNQLREMILTGDLATGSPIEERRLAEEMQVSRTPLREAISQLVTEGIIEYRPYRGNLVRRFNAKQVQDLYQVRKALEALAMRLAIPKLSQEHIEKIRCILDNVQTALDRGDIEAYNENDRRFHQTIVEITGNDTLMEALNRLAAQIQLVRFMANTDPSVVQRTAKERPLILAALEARDADRAAQLMEAHIEGVCAAVVAQIQRLEAEDEE
jgi:DNA-binding GntR family transcriptional regulator